MFQNSKTKNMFIKIILNADSKHWLLTPILTNRPINKPGGLEGLDQTWPKCGLRATCSPPNFFCGPWIKGAQFFFVKCTPKNAIFDGYFDFFIPKNDIFEEHFGNHLWFSQICWEIFKKILIPLPPGMNLRPPEHYKWLKMARD